MTDSEKRSSIGATIAAAAWGMAIVAMQTTLWLLWFLLLMKCAPAMEIILVETDAALPQIAIHLLTTSRFVASFWYILALIGPPLMLLEIGVIVASARSAATWLTVSRYGLVTLFTLVPLLLLGWATLGACLAAHAAAMEMLPEAI